MGLDDVNGMIEGGIDQFRVQSFDSCQLMIIGSFDLDYYHDIELTFSDVAYINCPTDFCEPRFSDGGPTAEGRRFQIHTDEGQFEIVADQVVVVVGKVYHYDRGEPLLPGERIADWVKRDD